MTKVTRIVAALAVVIGCAADSRAQGENETRDSIQRVAKAGDRLTVTTATGTAVRGRLVSADVKELVLRTSDGERALAYAEIDEVRRRKNGIAAGAALGLLTGAALGLFVAAVVDDDASAMEVVAVTSAVGAGVGIGVDALISRNRTIYKRSAARQALEIQPRKAGAAVRWTVRW